MQTQTPKYQGEPSIQALASGLGTLGRYGDEYMVHAAHGETVVPAEILEANPELKNQLFQQMRLMGIKNPNRYVVGNSLNSINPLTGQPEFFFKKIFKAIKRVVKKIAPIVVPIIGNMIAPGIGGPVASALYSKATGGSWGDALKSAALSYGASALGSGVKSLINAPAGSGLSGFFSGVKQGALAPFDAASNLFSSGANNPLAQGIFGPRGMDLAFKSTGQTLGSSFAPGGNTFEKIAGTVFPSYQTFGGGQTFQGNQPVTATEQKATQLSGAGTEQSPINQPLNQPVTTGGGTDVNQANRFSNVGRGTGTGTGTGANINTDTGGGYQPGQTMQLGEQAQKGVFRPGSGYSDVAGGNVNVAGETVASAADTGSTLGNAYDWIKRNKYLVGAAAAGGAGLYYLSQEEEDPMPDREELLRMTDPERLAYEQFTQLSDEEKRGQRGHELLRQSGISPRYTPEQIANITGIGLEDAQDYYNRNFSTSFATGGIGTLSQSGTLEEANQRALQTGGEGSPFVHNNQAYRASSSGAQMQGAQMEAQGIATMSPATSELGTPTPPTPVQTGLATVSGGPIGMMKRLTGGKGVAVPNNEGIMTGGGNPLLARMMEQMAREADKNPPQQLNESVLRSSVMAPNEDNVALVTKRVAPNNITGGLQVLKQLGKADQGLSSFYQKADPAMMAGGGEVEGPGTGTSDSIPANLSDGEFVMTAEAVRNAGGGNRNLGAARMYDLMNRFERGMA